LIHQVVVRIHKK